MNPAVEQSTAAGWYALAGVTFAALAALFALGLLAHTIHALTRRYRGRTRP